uniref:Endonuclease III n=1 Tax=candidate division WOR-3 bacterium TaxID=2052148 RepID=A0A7C4U6B8_UNCW3
MEIEIDKILKILKEEVKKFNKPVVTKFSIDYNDPFIILISTVLSQRTKDSITEIASSRLFEKAKNPFDMLKLKEEEIERLIYPVGFYRTKAKRIKEICKTIIENYNGKVPDTIDELLKIKGVGRKTANLVITLGFNKPGICVDTHVHRISNRIGFVKTKTPFETEMELRKKLPKKWWKIYNDLLVQWGQNVCKPVKPLCNDCAISKYCKKII